MNLTLEHLIALQMQDLEAKRLREALAEAPRRVAAFTAALTKARAAVTASQDTLKKETVLRHGLANDATDRRGKITRLRKQMETAANATQITALEHEITFAEGAITKFEDDELLSMERTETAEAALLKQTAAAIAAEAALDTERTRSAASVIADTAALAAAEAERKALRATLIEHADAALSQYDRVSKSRGTGLSEAVGGKCSACQMMVRPQRWNDLTGRDHLDSLFTCESCGRTLWYDPRKDAPSNWEPGKISESAS